MQQKYILPWAKIESILYINSVAPEDQGLPIIGTHEKPTRPLVKFRKSKLLAQTQSESKPSLDNPHLLYGSPTHTTSNYIITSLLLFLLCVFF